MANVGLEHSCWSYHPHWGWVGTGAQQAMSSGSGSQGHPGVPLPWSWASSPIREAIETEAAAWGHTTWVVILPATEVYPPAPPAGGALTPYLGSSLWPLAMLVPFPMPALLAQDDLALIYKAKAKALVSGEARTPSHTHP